MTKPTKWHVHPAKTQFSLGIRPVWSVFTVRMKKAWVLSYPLSGRWRLWSDWMDAQADLGLRWAHSHFVGFVMRWLTWGHPWSLCSFPGCMVWCPGQDLELNCIHSHSLPFHHFPQLLSNSEVLQTFFPNSKEPARIPKMSHLMSKPTKWQVHPAKTQISLGIRPVWLHYALNGYLWTQAFFHADNEDSDQTGRMPWLIWVSLGAPAILLFLSWGGLNAEKAHWNRIKEKRN